MGRQVAASSAIVLLQVVTYIVPAWTRGPVWKLSVSPTWNMQAGTSREALAALICVQGREAGARVVVGVVQPVGGGGGGGQRGLVGTGGRRCGVLVALDELGWGVGASRVAAAGAAAAQRGGRTSPGAPADTGVVPAA